MSILEKIFGKKKYKYSEIRMKRIFRNTFNQTHEMYDYLSIEDNEEISDEFVKEFVKAISTEGFKGEIVKGDCSYYENGIKPKVNKTYIVRFGDPLEFEAKYIGTFFNTKDIYELTYKDILVFKQGKDYFFSNKKVTEIIRKVK